MLRGIDDKEYQIGLERARRFLAKADASQSLDNLTAGEGDETGVNIQAQLVGRYIVRGWKGEIKDENGSFFPYSPEVGISLLEANQGFLAWAIMQAAKISADKARRQEETLGKLSPVSSGSANGKAAGKSSA